MTVTITNLLDGAAEVLSANVGGTDDHRRLRCGPRGPHHGVDTVANYQQVLRTIQYNNLSCSQNPSTAARSISFVANDGGVLPQRRDRGR